MNKFVLLLAPVLSAGIIFGYSHASFSKSGTARVKSENTDYPTLSEKGEKLLNKEIIDPLRAKNGQSKQKLQSFSRCPSGVTYWVDAGPTEGNEYFTGEVIDRKGCEEITVCYFRLDRKEEVLEAKSKNEAGSKYLPVAEWKKSAKAEWSF